MAEEDALAIEGPEALDKPGICGSDDCGVVMEGGVDGTGGKAICGCVYGADSTYNCVESMYEWAGLERP
jgi:hypothetical protein